MVRYNRLTLSLNRTEYVYLPGTRLPEVPPEGLVIEEENIRRVEGLEDPYCLGDDQDVAASGSPR
jgi:hypothetical protein